MWEKDFRKLVFYIIYQALFLNWNLEFWQNLDYGEKLDLIYKNKEIIDSLKSQKNSLENPKNDLIQINYLSDDDYPAVVDKILNDFLLNKDNYWQKICQNLKDTKKTYTTVSTCLYTYLLEKDYIDSQFLAEEISTQIKQNLIGKYIKLAQDFIGDENVSLVHAVLIKL
jgi:hypothetical protein